MIDEYLQEASALRDQGKLIEAQDLCERAIAIAGKDYRPHFLLGLIHVARTNHRMALDAFEKAVEFEPENKEALLNYGMSLKDFGKFDEAKQLFEQTIEIDPNYSPGFFNLVSVQKITPGNPIIEKAEAMARADFESPNFEGLAAFALGKIYDDLGAYDKAFGQYKIANELQGKVYDHQNTLTMFERKKTIFTRELMESRKGEGNPSHAPVFIIGMPRSGSSLIEDILSRSENITGYNERTEAAQIVIRLERSHPSKTPYPEVVPQINGEQFSQLGDLYLMLLTQIEPYKERAVDKNLLNHSIAGFLRLMFPNGSIIHTYRDPIDTCLSCYFQNFRTGMEFSFDLADLGRRYAAYADLMDHWRSVMGESLYEVKLEDFTKNKDEHIKTLFSQIGMDAPTSVETPADRAIPTASGWQARQPIYETPAKRWKNYEKHLGPLFDALEGAGFKYNDR